MSGRNCHLNAVAFVAVFFFGIVSCKENKPPAGKKMENSDSAKPVFHKPPSSFQDTLKIQGEAAVFYTPDELQLEKIKKQTKDHCEDYNVLNRQ